MFKKYCTLLSLFLCCPLDNILQREFFSTEMRKRYIKLLFFMYYVDILFCFFDNPLNRSCLLDLALVVFSFIFAVVNAEKCQAYSHCGYICGHTALHVGSATAQGRR